MNTTTKKKSAAAILAQSWGWDISEIKEHRYQYGKTAIPVYAFSEGYYTVSTTTPKMNEYKWSVWSGDQTIAQANNTQIWFADVNG